MKDYRIVVKLELDNFISAENKKEAIKIVKQSFLQDYNIELEDSELIEVEEITLPYTQGEK
jgi:hypothetical protein